MMFGNHLFEAQEGALVFGPEPCIPAYLVPEDGKISATLLGSIPVHYYLPQVQDYIPGEYTIEKMNLHYKNGSIANVSNSSIQGKMAEDIRNGMVREIEVFVL